MRHVLWASLFFWYCMAGDAQEKKREIALLKIEIAELEKECQAVHEIVRHHKMGQAALSAEIDRLSMSNRKRVLPRIRLQEMKSQTRWLLGQITLFLNKKIMLQEFLIARRKSLEEMLWNEVEKNFPLKNEADIAPLSTIRWALQELDRLAPIKIALPTHFYELDPRWEMAGGEGIEKCLEKKMVWEHITQTYLKFSRSLEIENRRLSRHLFLLRHLLALEATKEIAQKLEKKIRTEQAMISSRMERILSDLVKAQTNAARAEREFRLHLERK